MQLALKRCIAFSVLAVLSVIFIDKPLALWIHSNHFDNLVFFEYITEDLPMVLSWAAVFLLIFVRPSVNIGNRWLYIVYLFWLTETTIYVKQGLKGVFARYWPKTWIHGNLSLIGDNVYGFNWFGGFAFNGGAFPSGHTTLVGIICLSLAILYPQFARLWYFLIALIIFSLLMMDFHFLGDCFAGLALASLFAGFGFAFYQYLLRKFSKPENT